MSSRNNDYELSVISGNYDYGSLDLEKQEQDEDFYDDVALPEKALSRPPIQPIVEVLPVNTTSRPSMQPTVKTQSVNTISRPAMLPIVTEEPVKKRTSKIFCCCFALFCFLFFFFLILFFVLFLFLFSFYFP